MAIKQLIKLFVTVVKRLIEDGDTKGSAKGGESSAKKDVQPSPNAQIAHQGSFSQGVNYATSQVRKLIFKKTARCKIALATQKYKR
ncbi:hypothetical protein SO802_030395 [Lithocarpus litseifolius]|uniref:Uncharacterized protein n=1 Tax=Lithocarpus litseifolius TaxID=425828 RepID=A0AAW2BKW6_9ROSI